MNILTSSTEGDFDIARAQPTCKLSKNKDVRVIEGTRDIQRRNIKQAISLIRVFMFQNRKI
jgi:hypothetical protein